MRVASIVVAFLCLLYGAHASAQSSSAEISAHTSANAGNSHALNMNGAGGSNNLIINGGTVPPKVLPQPGVAPVAIPQVIHVFPNQAGLPVELIAIAIDDAYMSLCNPQAGERDLPIMQMVSKSGKVKVTFTAHQNFEMKSGASDKRPVVALNNTGQDTIRCLGVLHAQVTPEAVKGAFPMGRSAVTTEAQNTMAELLKGIGPNAVLVTHSKYWGGSLGQSAQGTGMTGGIGVNLGINVTGGMSSIDGVNNVVTRISGYWLVGVRVPANDPYAVQVDIAPPISAAK